jgi:hypothetical protein
MKEIPLSQGLVAFVDDDDFERLSAVKWWAKRDRRTFYAIRKSKRSKDGRRQEIEMSTLILPVPAGMLVDHKDGNGLNNQKNNLRAATRSQNAANSKKALGRTSRFKGVKKTASGKWDVNLCVMQDGERSYIYRGEFKEEVDAATAYNFLAEEYFGEFARFNTPEGCL